MRLTGALQGQPDVKLPKKSVDAPQGELFPPPREINGSSEFERTSHRDSQM